MVVLLRRRMLSFKCLAKRVSITDFTFYSPMSNSMQVSYALRFSVRCKLSWSLLDDWEEQEIFMK